MNQVAIESTTNAWHVYDRFLPLVERVVVAAQAEQGRTALIAAAYQDNLSVTELLIPP